MGGGSGGSIVAGFNTYSWWEENGDGAWDDSAIRASSVEDCAVMLKLLTEQDGNTVACAHTYPYATTWGWYKCYLSCDAATEPGSCCSGVGALLGTVSTSWGSVNMSIAEVGPWPATLNYVVGGAWSNTAENNAEMFEYELCPSPAPTSSAP